MKVKKQIALNHEEIIQIIKQHLKDEHGIVPQGEITISKDETDKISAYFFTPEIEESMEIVQIFKKRMEEFGISVRLMNACTANDLVSLQDLQRYMMRESDGKDPFLSLHKMPHMGLKSIDEIKELLSKNNLRVESSGAIVSCKA